MIKIFQNLFLFIIAILLVTGFYYHAEFYKLGWFGLLIIGSIVTFVILKVILYLNFNKYYNKKFDGIIIFKPEDVNAVKLGQIKQIVRLDRGNNIKPGGVYKAKLNVMSGLYFAELLIKNIFRKRLNELSDTDIFLTGAKSRKDFIKRWLEKHGEWNPQMNVKLVLFESINET